MISIITPSLDPNINKIKNTLTSILNNNGQYEIILILQKTAEKKIELLKNHYFNKNKLKIIIDDGVGISRARNIGIKYSSGEWILLLDDDIHIKDNIINQLEKVLSKYELFYYGNTMVMNSNSHYLRFYTTNNNLSIWSYNRICSVALIINKKVFENIGLFDENLGAGSKFGSSEESDLILRALFRGIKIKYLKEYTVYHENACHSALKIENYAKGLGAVYKKYIFSKYIKLYFKFIIDILIRILLLLTFQKKRFLFFFGFIKGFKSYKLNDRKFNL